MPAAVRKVGAAVAAGGENDAEEVPAEADGQDAPADVGPSRAASEAGTPPASDAGPAPSDSNVSCVTADFAMQNVLLQMGLRVVAPNGLAIRRLSRHVLRCSACFLVTKVRHYALLEANGSEFSGGAGTATTAARFSSWSRVTGATQ